MRVAALSLLPLMLLAGCGGDDDAGTFSANTTAAPVAAVAPPEGKSWIEVVSKTEAGGYVMGNPDAPVKLVEYGSRSCPVCGRFAVDGMEPLKEKYVATGKVSYEFRDFLIHPQDLSVSLLGHCVDEARFFPILEQMFALQPQFNERLTTMTDAQYQRIQTLPPAEASLAWAEILGYLDFMKQRGVPETKVRQCLSDQSKIEALSNQLKAASQRGVNGTPTFYINDQVVPNTVSWQQLEPMLRAAGA